jgi:integrase
VIEHSHKSSIDSDVGRLKGILPWIARLPIDQVHMGTLQPWLGSRRRNGVSAGTINHGLQVIRRILNLASSDWIDENGLTWLHAAPTIRMLPNQDKRKPYPLDWEEQTKLFQLLPKHLVDMALFAVNTGCRDSEICGLRWDWEVKVATLNTSVFLIPADRVKNREERLVVLNRFAKSVVDENRGKGSAHVFGWRGEPIKRMNNSAWRNARDRAGLPHVRVHDLKHTFGRRLRAAGVSFEDRQDLLGHRSSRITTHYSAVDLSRLIEASNLVCLGTERRPELVVLKNNNSIAPAKLPQSRGFERRSNC